MTESDRKLCKEYLIKWVLKLNALRRERKIKANEYNEAIKFEKYRIEVMLRALEENKLSVLNELENDPLCL